jgi:hypothetical protein
LAEFVAQLLVPESSSSATSSTIISATEGIFLFNEGRSPSHIPFLNPDHIKNRCNSSPCQGLILWDIPPSPEVLAQLLHSTQAQQIHLMGGKFQGAAKHSVPLSLPLPTFLKAVHQGLLVVAKQVETLVTLPVYETASRFAATEASLLLAVEALALSSQLLSEPPSYNLTTRQLELRLGLLADDACYQTLATTLEHRPLGKALHTSLEATTTWRQLLLSAPIETLQQQALIVGL